MAAYSYRYSVSNARARLHENIRDLIAEALRQAALKTQSAWQETIYRTPGIWPDLRDRYAASIKVEIAPDGMGAKIYSDDPKAGEIESGEPARDMKAALNTSLKTRVAKHGQHAGMRYLIIPFRHNTPGASALGQPMPREVYAAVSDRSSFKPSIVKERSFRPNALGVHDMRSRQLLHVPARSYQWGSRLDTSGMATLNAKQKQHMNGMVSFRTNGQGQRQSSSFMTFRVMGEWQSGWIQPAKPAKPIVRTAAEVGERALKDLMDSALGGA